MIDLKPEDQSEDDNELKLQTEAQRGDGSNRPPNRPTAIATGGPSDDSWSGKNRLRQDQISVERFSALHLENLVFLRVAKPQSKANLENFFDRNKSGGFASVTQSASVESDIASSLMELHGNGSSLAYCLHNDKKSLTCFLGISPQATEADFDLVTREGNWLQDDRSLRIFNKLVIGHERSWCSEDDVMELLIKSSTYSFSHLNFPAAEASYPSVFPIDEIVNRLSKHEFNILILASPVSDVEVKAQLSTITERSIAIDSALSLGTSRQRKRFIEHQSILFRALNRTDKHYWKVGAYLSSKNKTVCTQMEVIARHKISLNRLVRDMTGLRSIEPLIPMFSNLALVCDKHPANSEDPLPEHTFINYLDSVQLGNLMKMR